MAVMCGSLAAARLAWAEGDVGISSPATVLPNPFVAQTAQPEVVPVEPALPRRGPITYHNPFATMSAAPPIDIPMRPGPVSRWRRPLLPLDQTAPVKSAILTAEPAKPAQPPWDQLPPVEDLLAKSVMRIVNPDTDSPAQPATSDDAIQFAPESLTQPAWFTPKRDAIRPLPPTGQVAMRDSAHADPFEAPANTLAGPAIGLPQDTAMPGGVSLSGEPRATPADVDLLPLVISDYADSPDGWFAEAQQLAQTAQSVDDLSAIIALCQRALANAPPPELATPLRRLAGWAHNRRGELQVDEGRHSDAIRDFQIAISLDPGCSLAIHNRAVTLAQQNETEAALRDFNRVIELNPGLAIAYRNRGELLSSLGRINEALRDYDRAIDGLPEDAALYRARGTAWQRLGDFERALADLNQAVQLAPDDPDAFTQRGNLAAERGAFDQALGDLQRAVAIDPNWAEAYRSLAWLHATCPDPRYRDAGQAVAAAERAAELSPPTDCYVLDALAAAHASAGRFDDAVSLQKQAMAAAPPDYAESLRHRLLLYQQGQPFVGGRAREVRAASHETGSAAVQ